MSEDTEAIQSWFSARLPETWFLEPAEVNVESGAVTVVGKLAEPALDASTPEAKSAAESGRISRFREETRPQRIVIAREAGERYGVRVTWGAVCGGTSFVFTRAAGEGRRGPGRRRFHGEWGGRRGPWERPGFRRMMARALWRRFARRRAWERWQRGGPADGGGTVSF